MNNVIQFPTKSDLFPEAKQALDEMVGRRMDRTGETLYQAREYVAKWIIAFIGD